MNYKPNDPHKSSLVKESSPQYIETDFVTGIEGVLAQRLSVWVWAIPLGLMLLVSSLMAWAWMAEVDVVSPASGEIKPTQEVQLVQPKDVGVVQEIYVKNGDVVKKGQLLVQLADEDIQNELMETNQTMNQLAIELMVMDLLKQCLEEVIQCVDSANQVPPLRQLKLRASDYQRQLSKDQQRQGLQLFYQRWLQFVTQSNLYHDKIRVLQADLNASQQRASYLQQLVPMYDTRLQRLQMLLDENLTAGAKVEEAMEQWMEQNQKLLSAQLELKNLSVQKDVAQSELAAFRQQTITQNRDDYFLMQAELEVEQIRQLSLHDRLREKRIESPVEGVIYDRTIDSIGGVVQSAQVLMKILPGDAELQAKVKILNKDVGFIAIGDRVKVKVDAYPFIKHGVIHGQIANISEASVMDEQLGAVFPATIQFINSEVQVNDQPAAFVPGMTVISDIYQGKRLMAEYILTPLLRYKNESLRER